MPANLRFSSNSINGKNYLGGPVVAGANGIFSQNMITTNAVFDAVLKSENIAGTQDYRCLYFQNDYTDASQVYDPTIQILSETSSAIFAVGFLSDKNVIAASIANENTAPAGITFITPATTDAPIAMIKGAVTALLPGEFVGIWFRRTPVNIGGSGTITGELQFQIQFKT